MDKHPEHNFVIKGPLKPKKEFSSFLSQQEYAALDAKTLEIEQLIAQDELRKAAIAKAFGVSAPIATSSPIATQVPQGSGAGTEIHEPPFIFKWNVEDTALNEKEIQPINEKADETPKQDSPEDIKKREAEQKAQALVKEIAELENKLASITDPNEAERIRKIKLEADAREAKLPGIIIDEAIAKREKWIAEIDQLQKENIKKLDELWFKFLQPGKVEYLKEEGYRFYDRKEEMKAEVAALGTEIPQYLTMSAEERIQKGNDLSEEVRSSEERYVGYTGDDVHDRGIKWKVANLKQSFFYVIGRILEEKQSYDVEKQKRSREFHPFDYYLLDRTSIQARERSDYFTQNSNNIPFFSEEYQLRGTSLYPEIRGAYSNGYSILNKKFTLNNSYYKSGYCVVSPSGETTSEDSGLTPDEAEKRLKEKSAEYLTQMRKQFDLNQEIQAKQNELNEIAKEQNTTADAYLVQFGRDSQLDPKTPDYIQLPNVASNITPENRVEGLELLKSIQALEEEMKQLEIRLEEAKKLEDDYAGYKENVPLVIAEGRKLATEGLENWQKVLASPPEDFTDEDLQEINTMIQYYSWVVSWTTNAEKHALNLSINEWEDVLKDKFTRHDDEYMEGITYARGPSSLGLAKYEKEFLADQKAHPFRHFLLSKMNETVKKYFRKYNNQIDLSNFAENQNNENFDVKVYHPQAEAIAGGFHIRKGDFFSTNGILLIREDSQKYPRADFRAKGETAPRKHPYRLIMPDGTEQKINSVTEDEAREMLELEAKEYQTKLVEEFNTLQANKA